MTPFWTAVTYFLATAAGAFVGTIWANNTIYNDIKCAVKALKASQDHLDHSLPLLVAAQGVLKDATAEAKGRLTSTWGTVR